RLPLAVLVVQDAVEEGAREKDFFAIQADGARRRLANGALADALGLLDLLERRPGLAIKMRPFQFVVAVAAGSVPLLPDAGDAFAERNQARLLERVTETDSLLLGRGRARHQAALALGPPFPGEAVVVGVAKVDAIHPQTANHSIRRPEPAVRRPD